MDKCSYFIPGKALFGSFPTQETVIQLESEGVRCFVDLTNFEESKTTPYYTSYTYIRYPIIDQRIPVDWKSFAQLVIAVCDIIQHLGPDEKVYVHCKGGHGRSGIVVACIFCYYCNLCPDEALVKTTTCHSKRPLMNEKWRKIGSPQGKRQKEFVRRFFRPLRFANPELVGYTMGFHNLSHHPVTIPQVGTFPNVHLAFQYFRSPTSTEYVKQLQNGRFCPQFIVHSNKDWDSKKREYMYQVLEYKFRQHDNLRKNLMNTGLRPLIKLSKDPFWGDGGNGKGQNVLGQLLGNLRIQFLIEDFCSLYN